MKFAHLLSRITGTPWLITDDALANITSLIESRLDGVALGEVIQTAAALPAGKAGTAIIPIHGVVGKRLSALEMACGGADIGAIEAAFDAANSDTNINRIVLHVDSPGGTVTGVPELAQKIYDTKRKPVTAISDTQIGSAAYWISSAADQIVVTPTAIVGSIGAVAMVRESATNTSADGRTRLKVFRSGADKMMGADGALTEAQAAVWQERVDFLGSMFRSDVTRARPSVGADSMTGLAYFGTEAVKRHLADRVVPNLAEAIG